MAFRNRPYRRDRGSYYYPLTDCCTLTWIIPDVIFAQICGTLSDPMMREFLSTPQGEYGRRVTALDHISSGKEKLD
jgi:hypothetical protein